MSLIVADETTAKIAEIKTDTKKDTPKIKKKFALMLVEFNVIPYVVGFGIALAIQNFLLKFGEYTVIHFLKIKNQLFISFLVMLLMIVFCYILIYFIFYRYIYTEDISRETVIKQAITEKKKEEAKKEISKDKEIKKTIEKDINVVPEEKLLNIIEEYKYF